MSRADIIVTRVGPHAEYIGFAAHDGTTAIIVYAQPLLALKWDLLRALHNSLVHVLDIVITDDPYDDDNQNDDAAAAGAAESSDHASDHATSERARVCSALDFTTMVFLPSCLDFFFSKPVSVEREVLDVYLAHARALLTTQTIEGHDPFKPNEPKALEICTGPAAQTESARSCYVSVHAAQALLITRLLASQSRSEPWGVAGPPRIALFPNARNFADSPAPASFVVDGEPSPFAILD